MPHKLRKTRKKRGSRTVGYGRVGQHRDTGGQPNRKAGRHKHKWSYVLRYEPDYFGKTGFTSPKSLRQKLKIINVGKLDQMAKLATETKDDKPLVDLEKLGYTKLLGTGRVTKPIVVKVSTASKSAADKIKEAGGQVLSGAEEQGE